MSGNPGDVKPSRKQIGRQKKTQFSHINKKKIIIIKHTILMLDVCFFMV